VTAASTQRDDIVEAAHVLSRLGLVTAYGHVSARRGAAMVITPAAELAAVTAPDLVDVPLGTEMLPTGAPAEAWAHLALYRARPDAESIARAQPASAYAASALTASLVPLHGQAAWLGESIPVHDSAQLLRSADQAERAAASLRTGEAMLLRGNGALTIGATPGIAVARMWLLAAVCDTYVATLGRSGTKSLTADEVASWRAVGPELLPRLWQYLRRAGGPA
jgi:HCOMODA/2-hydroxy-3-carboxy-muconic semialdehyde decarboxylase